MLAYHCGAICCATQNGGCGIGVLLPAPPYVPRANAAGEPQLFPEASEPVGPINVERKSGKGEELAIAAFL